MHLYITATTKHCTTAHQLLLLDKHFACGMISLMVVTFLDSDHHTQNAYRVDLSVKSWV